MRSYFWNFIQRIADTGTWRKAHISIALFFPVTIALAVLLPHPPLWLYAGICALISPLAQNAIMFPAAIILMDRRRKREFAG